MSASSARSFACSTQERMPRVQLEETFDLPCARPVAWDVFRDVPMLVSCLAGAKLTSAPDADPLQLVFSVKLGPISANFAGQGSVTYAEDYSGSLAGTGTDRATNSRVKGDAKFSLHEIEDGTRVQVVVDYTLTGMLAQVGRPGIVKEIAANITQQFAANLRAKLAEDLSGASAEASELDGGKVLWNVV